MPRTVKTLDRGPRPVGRQFEMSRRAFQMPAPVSKLARHLIACQKLLLPQRIVGILNRELRQRGLFRALECFVKRCEFLIQHAERPTVADDVVHVDHEHVIVCIQTDQQRAHERR